MKRGEIWEADFSPDKPRPVLILSRNSMSPRRPDITVAFCTTNVRHLPFEVLLTPAQDGVREICAVNLDSINTIAKIKLQTGCVFFPVLEWPRLPRQSSLPSTYLDALHLDQLGSEILPRSLTTRYSSQRAGTVAQTAHSRPCGFPTGRARGR